MIKHNLYIYILLVISMVMLTACSASAALPTQAIGSNQDFTATKNPATNPTSATIPANTSGRPTTPAEYAAKNNPLAGNSVAITAGKTEFSFSCASCHGNNADGNGRISGSPPKPANLIQSVKETSDGYLFWRISEGGKIAPFNSRMPSFKGELNEEKIWQVISYLQTLK